MLGFIIAVAAGYATPHIEGPVASPVVQFLEGKITIAPDEKRVIAFMLMLVAALILSAFFGSVSAWTIIIGAILGYFGHRIFMVIMRMLNGQTDAE